MDTKNTGARKGWRLYRALEWPALLVLTVLAFALGYLGFRQYFASIGETRSILDSLYLALQLFMIESGAVSRPVPIYLEIARFLAPAIVFYAAGKALAAIFRRQLQRLHFRLLKNHVVICGGGIKGVLLARAFVRRGETVVIIERDKEADTIVSAEESGANMMIGDATQDAHLRQAGIARAAYLISVCGNDGTNAEVAVRAHQLSKSRTGEPLVCAAHLIDPELFRLLREQWFSTQDEEFFHLEFFNIFDLGAGALLEQYPPFDVEPNAGGAPHVLIAGISRLGESLLVQMARRWWRLNGESGARLYVTLIDRVASSKADSLRSRYPGFADTCRLNTLDMELPAASFETIDFLGDEGDFPPVSVIYTCFDNDSLSLSTSLALHERFEGRSVPMVARMQEDAGLATLLRGEGPSGSEFANLHVFGLLDQTWTIESVLSGVAESLARALHENYRRNRVAEGESVATNPFLVSWGNLPEDVRHANRQQALAIRKELRRANRSLEPQRDWRTLPLELSTRDLDLLARIEHDRWVTERKAQGWTKGLKKDPVHKTHPWLEPWDELKEEDAKTRVREDMNKLPLALAEIGFRIRRTDEVNSGRNP